MNSEWTTMKSSMERDFSALEATTFKAFCNRHKDHLDDSFLGEEELANFAPNDENPTVVGLRGDTLSGAASLILDDYHVRGRRARFRILYSEDETPDSYAALLAPVRKHMEIWNRKRTGTEPEGLTHWFCFVRDGSDTQRICLEANGFRLYRTSHLLIRGEMAVPETILPEGVVIRPFQFGKDEEAYCRIRNAAFRNLLGAEAPLLPEDVANMAQDGDTLPGGIFLLEDHGTPVGIVRTAKDPGDAENEAMVEIAPLAILPGHQGKGYGTLLLRHAIRHGRQLGFARAVLCVNAENTPALGLYLREGFAVHLGFACMREDFP